MITLLSIVALGFFLGMRHATDPDHVIAVSTIVTREHDVRRSAMIGAAWGVGHTLTILAVGGAIILFRITLPPRLGLAMELAVAVMLIFLGLKNLGGLLAWPAERAGVKTEDNAEASHYHAHGDYVHVHRQPQGYHHPHDPQRTPIAVMDRWFRNYDLYRLMRPLFIGIVHGLAGSAAIALLVLSTIANLRWAIAYLAVFGIGTVLGMMLITLTLGSTFAYGQKKFARIGRHLTVAAGLVSLGFGLLIAYQIGFVDGLFMKHPHWTPR
ncbi:MAG TPA: high-affinity nickel-transport family protein [Candidatus Angelobacter sp.]|nr:high-affinity nickel-transport family protein [Candidatus Angelobacter sp.]